MAKRYRYAFAKKKEAKKGKISVVLSIASFIAFLAAVIISFIFENEYGFVVGGISLCGALFSVYGFFLGLSSFSEEDRTHKTSLIGSIVNGIIMVVWIGIFILGV